MSEPLASTAERETAMIPPPPKWAQKYVRCYRCKMIHIRGWAHPCTKRPTSEPPA